MEAKTQNVAEIPKGSVGQWKAIGKTLMILLRIRKEAVAIRLKKREDALNFYERFLQIYSKVARAWLRKSIKKPLLSIYADED